MTFARAFAFSAEAAGGGVSGRRLLEIAPKRADSPPVTAGGDWFLTDEAATVRPKAFPLFVVLVCSEEVSRLAELPWLGELAGLEVVPWLDELPRAPELPCPAFAFPAPGPFPLLALAPLPFPLPLPLLPAGPAASLRPEVPLPPAFPLLPLFPALPLPPEFPLSPPLPFPLPPPLLPSLAIAEAPPKVRLPLLAISTWISSGYTNVRHDTAIRRWRRLDFIGTLTFAVGSPAGPQEQNWGA